LQIALVWRIAELLGSKKLHLHREGELGRKGDLVVRHQALHGVRAIVDFFKCLLPLKVNLRNINPPLTSDHPKLLRLECHTSLLQWLLLLRRSALVGAASGPSD